MMVHFSFYLLCVSLLCIAAQFHTEEQCAQAVSAQGSVTDGSTLSEQLIQAMNRGFWNCSKTIVRISSEAKLNDFRTVFDVQYRLILSELTALKATVDSYLSNPIVSPAFQWAQSANEVMLNVKFSHKIDAPATLNVEATNITILSDRLSLEASDGRKIFKLELEFLKDIVPDDSRYEMASVGRMTFTFKKAEGPSKWSRLLKQTDSKLVPSNMHKWFAMQEKYDAELSKLEVNETSTAASSDSGASDSVKSKNDKKGKEKAKTTKATKASPKKKDKDDDEDDDDDDDKDVSSSVSADHPNYERIEALKKSQADELRALQEEAVVQKKRLDVQWREDKRRVDEEASGRRRAVERRIREEIEALESQVGSIVSSEGSKAVGAEL